MDRTYWQKQTPEKPLFDEIIWGKPQRKNLAGNLLIIGGNSHAIAAPSEAYKIAINQGIGECKVAMPDATRKLLGPKPPPNIDLFASNPSGSFSTKAIDELKNDITWATATLAAGDIGKSSETAILFDKLMALPGLQAYTADAADDFAASPLPILRRKDTLLVLEMPQLQKFALNAKLSHPFTHDMDLLQLVDRLHEFTNLFKCHILMHHKNHIIAASGGQVVSTKFETVPSNWKVMFAAAATVWWLQNPSQAIKSIATAVTQLELS